MAEEKAPMKMKSDSKDALVNAMAKPKDKKEKKAASKGKKKIKELMIRAAHSGGHIVTHKHHAPMNNMEHDEEHAVPEEGLGEHVMANKPAPMMAAEPQEEEAPLPMAAARA